MILSDDPTDAEIEEYLTTPRTTDRCPGCGGTTTIRRVIGERVVGLVMECDCGETWRVENDVEAS